MTIWLIVILFYLNSLFYKNELNFHIIQFQFYITILYFEVISNYNSETEINKNY